MAAEGDGGGGVEGLEARVLEALEPALMRMEHLRIDFDDSTGEYHEAVVMVRRYAVLHGYHQVYEFWYDGCNQQGIDMIRGRPIRPDNGPTYGTCWRSTAWTFDDDEVEQIFAEERERLAELARVQQDDAELARSLSSEEVRPAPAADQGGEDGCLVCFDAPAETLVMPCGHAVACRACSQTLAAGPNRTLCILCRGLIGEILTDGRP